MGCVTPWVEAGGLPRAAAPEDGTGRGPRWARVAVGYGGGTTHRALPRYCRCESDAAISPSRPRKIRQGPRRSDGAVRPPARCPRGGGPGFGRGGGGGIPGSVGAGERERGLPLTPPRGLPAAPAVPTGRFTRFCSVEKAGERAASGKKKKKEKQKTGGNKGKRGGEKVHLEENGGTEARNRRRETFLPPKRDAGGGARETLPQILGFLPRPGPGGAWGGFPRGVGWGGRWHREATPAPSPAVAPPPQICKSPCKPAPPPLRQALAIAPGQATRVRSLSSPQKSKTGGFPDGGGRRCAAPGGVRQPRAAPVPQLPPRLPALFFVVFFFSSFVLFFSFFFVKHIFLFIF